SPAPAVSGNSVWEPLGAQPWRNAEQAGVHRRTEGTCCRGSGPGHGKPEAGPDGRDGAPDGPRVESQGCARSLAENGGSPRQRRAAGGREEPPRVVEARRVREDLSSAPPRERAGGHGSGGV